MTSSHHRTYYLIGPVQVIFNKIFITINIKKKYMVKIGFTGSRTGMTIQARKTFEEFLKTITIDEFHHGDCIGCDAEAHEIVSSKGITTIIHPPTNSKARAFCLGNSILPAKEYLKRNQDIVNCTDVLIAFTPTKEEIVRSGTWSTIRYAKKQKKHIIIFHPDGTWRYY